MIETITPVASLSLGNGIRCIDTAQERPQMACCYLIDRDGELAFVEAGTTPGVPRLLALLAEWGYRPEQVRYVMPTHVHLDHAGAAGTLMRELPNAQLVVHPRGARHLIEPAKLIAGATAVYGAEAVARMYGEIVAVPEARVLIADDGLTLRLGSSQLQCIDTPGHARHHYSVWDADSRGFFTGDTFGLSYRELDTAAGPFLMPTTTPVQFDPEAWLQTLDRYLSFAPQRMYLTHYAAVGDVEKLAAGLRDGIGHYRHVALALADAEQRHTSLVDTLFADTVEAIRRHGCELPLAQLHHLLDTDIELNAQGLEVWLDQQRA